MTGSRRDSATPVSEGDAAAPHLPRRRHRGLTAPSGFALALCAMLPTLRLCSGSHDALPGFMLPPLWPMYLLGLAVAIAALRWAKSQVWGWVVLGVIWGSCLTALFLMVLEALSGDVPLRQTLIVAGAAAGLASPTLGRFGEPLVARSSALAAATCAILFAVIAQGPDFVWGVWAGCAMSGALACGCLWWWLEARRGVA